MHSYVHCSIVIYNSQDLEIAQVPISRWVHKIAVVHLHNGILCGHKKEGALTFCDSMDGPGDYYAKWSKPVRERPIPYDLIYMWNLMKKNKLMNKIETERHVHRTDWERSEGTGEGGTGWKQLEGLVKEHTCTIHGHRQQCGDREKRWWGLGGGGQMMGK